MLLEDILMISLFDGVVKMPEFDYCVLEKVRERQPGQSKPVVVERIVHCNNPEDKQTIEKGLQEGRSFKRMRKDLGYAGKFKKISDVKHDGIYCTDQNDALQLHLGLKEGYSIEAIMEELGYTQYGWWNVAHGYAIHKFWNNKEYDTVVVPIAPMFNRREIYLRHKDEKPVDRNRLWDWINTFGD